MRYEGSGLREEGWGGGSELELDLGSGSVENIMDQDPAK